MELSAYHVDAFTRAPFSGNPAAVVLLPAAAAGALGDGVLQAVAAEFALSETAFITPLRDGDGAFAEDDVRGDVWGQGGWNKP
jgi:PhzF family phenazine biosynthesis protein